MLYVLSIDGQNKSPPPACVLSPDWSEFLNLLPQKFSNMAPYIYLIKSSMVFEIKFMNRTTYIFLM
jgi:hypothetical protein